ncbi:MAG: thioredoxin domain-containing protein [Solirubrobacterales bacterium]|nr:thioredoxin domain-containing protein [Solirubrobacterales bacterium]
MADLRSAEVRPISAADHVRGRGPEAIVYLDLACPHCAASWPRIREQPLRLCVRHFPLAGRRPRSPALHAATEAAASQRREAFWEMFDSIYADQGHQDDPHLWARARDLALELERFERDRRSATVAERVRADFESGIRAGVAATPTAFVGGERISADVADRLAALAAG